MSDSVVTVSRDVLTSLKYLDTRLVASSLDGSLAFVDASLNVDRVVLDAPVLDSAVLDSTVYAALANGSVQKVGFPAKDVQATSIGHDLPVQCVETHPRRNLVVSGSWDKSVQMADPRIHQQPTVLRVPGKVYAMDVHQQTDRFIVGLSSRQIQIYDFRKLDQPASELENGFRFQTTQIKFLPSGAGFLQSSIEGKVSLDLFQDTENSYAFKCHRQKLVVENEDIDLVNPVNCLELYDTESKFFTAGSDRSVCLWDYKSKKRVKQYANFEMSIVALAYNQTSHQLAIAMSDDSYKNMTGIDDQTNNKPAIASKIAIRNMHS
ncbi:hypothetical protein OGAPHI_003316 [Ogataea philodendri]|uniref:Uncharacterized protein n=1 Tax=Ogataea philodendri TaxID=1378263 RepID=A0A9P8P8P6_9ASCO|nr:uncharacterized protein OGAPHI_003316 [Ogataea philodendri]KAH3666867.1 hypothetical protein OGAPHI_003316 [Ogataea philodendri]